MAMAAILKMPLMAICHVFGANELKLGMWVASSWTKNISDGFCEILKFDLDLTPELMPHSVFQLFTLNIFFSETTGSIVLKLCIHHPSNEDT